MLPEVFFNPGRCALIAMEPPDAARRARVFRIVVAIAPDTGTRRGLGWSAEARAPDEVALVGDAAGAYLNARIDLLLRSNDIGGVVIAPDLPAELAANVASRCTLLGYDVLRPTTLEPLVARWREVETPRGWQAESKAAALLPDLDTRIHPDRAALLLIDVQNDFCLRQGMVGRDGAEMSMLDHAVPRLRELLASARSAGVLIIHVQAEYGQIFRNVGSPYRFPLRGGREPAVWTASAGEATGGNGFGADEVEVCLRGSWGAEPVAGMEPRPGEAVVKKHRYSAFRDTGLDVLLRANGIKTLVVGGVTTNCCVESTVREAAMHDYYVVVAEDCVAVKDRIADLHSASLEAQGLYFALVRPLVAIRAAWGLDAGAA